MLDWDNPLENNTNEKLDINLIDQTLNETSIKNSNELQSNRVTQPSNPDLKKISDNLTPVNPDDKRVINGQTDINQLAPFKYPWAWNFFLNANKNHWTPLDINMAQDVTDYRHKLTLEENMSMRMCCPI